MRERRWVGGAAGWVAPRDGGDLPLPGFGNIPRKVKTPARANQSSTRTGTSSCEADLLTSKSIMKEVTKRVKMVASRLKPASSLETWPMAGLKSPVV